VNNRDKNFTVAKVGKRMEQVDASIERYLAALDRADREESDVTEARTTRIKEKIAALRRQIQSFKEMEQQVQAAPDQQVSLTDPDARSMATSGRGTGMVGYNVQTAVDAEHHLIVAHVVTNVGHDRTQLAPMAKRRKRRAAKRSRRWPIAAISTASRFWRVRELAFSPAFPRHCGPASPSGAFSPGRTSPLMPRRIITPARRAQN
jgi:hypothetical protein